MKTHREYKLMVMKSGKGKIVAGQFVTADQVRPATKWEIFKFKITHWQQIRPGGVFERYIDVPRWLGWAIDFRRKEVRPLWGIVGIIVGIWLSPALFLLKKSGGHPYYIKDNEGVVREHKTYWHGMRLQIGEGAAISLMWWKHLQFQK